MKHIIIFLTALLVMASLLLLPSQTGGALAQSPGCTPSPAAGCPTDTPEPTETEEPRPTNTPAAPTATPLPITNPTGTPGTEGKKPADWTYNCVGGAGQLDCLLSAAETCEHEKGDATGVTNSDGSITVTCTHILIEPTPLPVANPTEEAAEVKWSGTCGLVSKNSFNCINTLITSCSQTGGTSDSEVDSANGTITITCTYPDGATSDPSLPVAGAPGEDPTENWTGYCGGDDVDACVDTLAALCSEEGGDLSVTYDDEGGAGVECENQSEGAASAEPTPLPVANPAEGDPTEAKEASCVGTDPVFIKSCVGGYVAACLSAGGSATVTTGSNPGADISCSVDAFFVVEPTPLPLAMPTDEGSVGNWTGGCFGDDLDECVNNLAALCGEEGGDVSVWYDDDGGAGVHCENESEAGATPGGWLPWLGGAVVGGVAIGLLLPAVQRVRFKPGTEL